MMTEMRKLSSMYLPSTTTPTKKNPHPKPTASAIGSIACTHLPVDSMKMVIIAMYQWSK